MSDIVIKVENLCKEYRLGVINHGVLFRDLQTWWARVRGKEDPNSLLTHRILQSAAPLVKENKREEAELRQHFLALNDVSFEVKRGEALGIIGRNGAGKSTLLKILSRITSASSGKIKIKGRISSLLEVGTGFHPELTGRENIYMNGAILGMRRWEIARKMDEIIAFAGLEKFIDTPVKRYSSGMYVRLAFAVAAHLDSDILVLDEVLAVGDADFQKKCLGKMDDVAKRQGRTVLFVSHNMAAVNQLCHSGIMLSQGQVDVRGDIKTVISNYMAQNIRLEKSNKIGENKNRSGNCLVRFEDFYLENKAGDRIDKVMSGEDIVLVFQVKVNEKKAVKVDLGFSFHNMLEEIITVLYSSYQNKYFDLDQGVQEIRCLIPNFSFSAGRIFVRGRIIVNNEESDWYKDNLGEINIDIGDYYGTGNLGFSGGNNIYTLLKGEWQK